MQQFFKELVCGRSLIVTFSKSSMWFTFEKTRPTGKSLIVFWKECSISHFKKNWIKVCLYKLKDVWNNSCVGNANLRAIHKFHPQMRPTKRTSLSNCINVVITTFIYQHIVYFKAPSWPISETSAPHFKSILKNIRRLLVVPFKNKTWLSLFLLE